MTGRAAALLVAMLTIGAWPPPAGAVETKAILVLHTYGYDTPSRFGFDAALARAFTGFPAVKVDLYIETLDLTRFAEEPQARLLRTYLREKYAGKNIAVVAAVYDPALAFLLDERDPLFPELPVAALLTRYPSSKPARVAAIWGGNALGETAALALRLHPSTRQIVVIDGAPQNSGVLHAEMRSQIAAIGIGVPVRFLSDLPLGELLTQVQALPPESILVMLRQVIGGGGAIASVDAFREIARVAPVPIYVMTDQMVGSGAVGGIVFSIEREATELAQLAIKLAGARSLPLPVFQSVMVPMFDWRQLRRWGVGPDQLPPQSEVRFRELSVWDQYQWYVVGGLSVFFTQSALITGLVLHRRRRRRAEVALQTSESALRTSHRQLRALAGRLITAQEAERARIARELHDDLSQKLALLSIELDQLLAGATGDVGVVRHAQAAAFCATDIATGVHNLSHELHPARLETLGLGLALRSLCRELSAAHGLSIEFNRGPIPRAIPPEVALCLFRIAQEALRNVVKHSGARQAQVRLRHANGMLELDVVDAGRGFADEPHGSGGLGLVSMRERVLLVGGQLAVQSSAHGGTRIEVRVPVVWVEAEMVYSGVG